MEIGASVLSVVAERILGYTIGPVVRQVGYLVHHKRNIEDLKKQVYNLVQAKDLVQHTVDEAKRNGEEIETLVENWFNGVAKIVSEVDECFTHDEQEKNTRCSSWSCLNVRSRHKLSRKANKMTQVVVELYGERNFQKVSHPVPPMGVGITYVKGFEAFDSRLSIVRKIMVALTDANTDMIGLHGMGGVGKTMLVKEVARQARESKFFDEVVMSTVTQTPILKKIQVEIADMLGLKFKEKSDAGRANRLRRRLKKEKSILVILDDIWAKLDLEAVGIPYGDDHKGCRILMTSRRYDVLFNDMGTQKNILVRELNKEESRNFFNKMTIDFVESAELKAIATQVADECAGLPLALATVANALKGKDLPLWNDALKQLKFPTQPNNNGMNKNVFSSLKLSYKSLKTEEARSVFLLCSLFPEDYQISIKYLLVYAMGMGFLDGLNTLAEARDRILSLVHELKNSCLLLDGINDEFVKMHDVVRDVAISIASKNESKYLVRHGVGQAWPKMDTFKYTAISLGCGDRFELPEELICPQLKFLLLVGTRSSTLKIAETFFEGIGELKVLDLTGLRIPQLPLSIRSLRNLQTLCLDDCELPDMSIIGELKKLETLSFRASDIESLPSVIGQLTHLKMLNLTDCSKLKVIPSNLISRLTELAELYMDNSFADWDIEEHSNEGSRAGISELNNLSSLTTLHVHIPDAKILPKASIFKGLFSYRIFIGDSWEWSGKYENLRTLKLKLNRSLEKEYGIQELLEKTEDLHLDELKGVKSVLYSLDRKGFPNLKHLTIQNNSEILAVINSADLSPPRPVAFPMLESLSLKNLMNLEVICCGRSLSVGSFRNLKKVKVESCDLLRSVFPSFMARDLSELQQLEISECSFMKTIVSKGKEMEIEVYDGVLGVPSTIEFPKLRSLILRSLPELIGFCSYENTGPSTLMGSSNFGSATKYGFHSLFNQDVSFPKLETLKLSSLNLREIWPDQSLTSFCCIQNLTSLTVEDCSSITYLFSITAAKSLPHLKHLEISNCQLMEHLLIIDERSSNIPATRSGSLAQEVIFPNLKRVLISRMDNLDTLWGSQVAFGSFIKLKTVDIKFCKRLQTIFPDYMLDKVICLETLTVADCGSLEEVFQVQQGLNVKDQMADDVAASRLRQLNLQRLPKLKRIWSQDPQGILGFPNLNLVHAIQCQSLKNLFPASIAKGLMQLEELKVQFCGVEEIVASENEADPTFVISEVATLFLWNLFELKSFYPGKHTLKCPSLGILDVRLCPKVKIFRPEDSEYVVFQETDDQNYQHDKVQAWRRPLETDQRLERDQSRLILREESRDIRSVDKNKGTSSKSLQEPATVSQEKSSDLKNKSGPSTEHTEPTKSLSMNHNEVEVELNEIKAQLASLVVGQNQVMEELAKVASVAKAAYDIVKQKLEADHEVSHSSRTSTKLMDE